MLGSLTGISSNVLMIFILFASFMLHSGVGQFFMDISVALAGRFRGGPAKVAVVSSGLYGTVSGSSVADCYATGTFTIPMMKKIGYRPEIAGAIEACASCGGPLMPPIMGAGAFIMSELTGIPYGQIIIAAALPAILYYAGIMATVHWEALKHGIGTMHADLPSMASLARRSLLFAPFFTIVYFLHAGYSPSKAALYSLLTAVVVSWVAGDSPMTPRRIFETMGDAMRSGVIIASVLAASGLIVASMSRTGFALAFSSAIIGFSGGYVIVALFLVFVVISVLGTGIPTTPAYILAVAVGGTALTNLGVDLLAAHLFVFYYAVLADVTPPVAVTAVAGRSAGRRQPDDHGLARDPDRYRRLPGAVSLRVPAAPAHEGRLERDRPRVRLGPGRHLRAIGRGRRPHVHAAVLAASDLPDRRLAGGHQPLHRRVARQQRRARRLHGVGLAAGPARAMRSCRCSASPSARPSPAAATPRLRLLSRCNGADRPRDSEERPGSAGKLPSHPGGCGGPYRGRPRYELARVRRRSRW